MYQYPYGDTQQLNLDWILAQIKELEAESGNIDMEEIANTLISATYNSATQYRRYDYCYRNGKLYRCLSDTIGTFDPAAWQEVLIGDDIPILTRLINAVDTSLTSLQTTVGNQGNDITNLQNALGDLDSDDVDNASLVVSGDTVTDALDALNSDIAALAGSDIANDSNVTGLTVANALNTLKDQYKIDKLYRFAIPNGTQINANESPAILTSWTYDNTVEVENGKIHIKGSGFALVFVHVIGSCGNNRLWFRVQGVNTNTQHISYGAYCTGDVFAVTQYSPGTDDYIWLEFLEPLLVGGGGTGAILIYVMLL